MDSQHFNMLETNLCHAAITSTKVRNTPKSTMSSKQEHNTSNKKRELSPGWGEGSRRWPLKKRRTCCTRQTVPCTAQARGAAGKRQRSPAAAETLPPWQAKRRRACSSHGKVLTVSRGQGAASERHGGPSHARGGPLRLVLEPPSVPVRKRRLPRGAPLQVDRRNHVRGSVNGHECRVLLDTGAQITVVLWSKALRLGLIDGTEATSRMRVGLWGGSRVIEVVRLSCITIELGGSVRVLTPAIVFPACLETTYDPETIILDAYQLRRGGMLQVFRPGGSNLFVRWPERLQRPSRRSPRKVTPDLLRVRTAQASGNLMTVLVDTGAKNVYVSAARRELLFQDRECRPLPRSLKVDVGDGCCLHLCPLETIPSNDQDFVFGTQVLFKQYAVMDHARHTLDLRVGLAWRRISTQVRGAKT